MHERSTIYTLLIDIDDYVSSIKVVPLFHIILFAAIYLAFKFQSNILSLITEIIGGFIFICAVYGVGNYKLHRYIKNRCGNRLIDIGTGTGTLARTLARNLPDVEIVGIDKNSRNIKRAKRRKTGKKVIFKIMDAVKIQYPDNSFDTVVAQDMLAYTNNIGYWGKIFKELYRITHKRGFIILNAPNKKAIDYSFWIGTVAAIIIIIGRNIYNLFWFSLDQQFENLCLYLIGISVNILIYFLIFCGFFYGDKSRFIGLQRYTWNQDRIKILFSNAGLQNITIKISSIFCPYFWIISGRKL